MALLVLGFQPYVSIQTAHLVSPTLLLDWIKTNQSRGLETVTFHAKQMLKLFECMWTFVCCKSYISWDIFHVIQIPDGERNCRIEFAEFQSAFCLGHVFTRREFASVILYRHPIFTLYIHLLG